MVVAVLPNLDKPGCSEGVEKLSVILNIEGIKSYIRDTFVAAGYIPFPYSSRDAFFAKGTGNGGLPY